MRFYFFITILYQVGPLFLLFLIGAFATEQGFQARQPAWIIMPLLAAGAGWWWQRRWLRGNAVWIEALSRHKRTERAERATHDQDSANQGR